MRARGPRLSVFVFMRPRRLDAVDAATSQSRSHAGRCATGSCTRSRIHRRILNCREIVIKSAGEDQTQRFGTKN